MKKTRDLDDMIEDLRSIGIEVRPVLKAFVPDNMGNPMRDDMIMTQMSVEDAYRQFCLSPMRDYDPFSDRSPLEILSKKP